jgi:hypothetical protein
MGGWIKAELYFASFFSYRMPGASPSYAPASPVPGPGAVKLALVDAAIQSTGNIDYGREVFRLVRGARLYAIPPEHLSTLRFFLKRLKPRGEQLLESTGVREYCHLGGPLTIYLELAEGEREVASLFPLLRRLGTTDSLVASVMVGEGEPPSELLWREPQALPVKGVNFQRRLVVSLMDLRPDASFDDVDPYRRGRGNPYHQFSVVLPMVLERRGENWALYRRVPFDLSP